MRAVTVQRFVLDSEGNGHHEKYFIIDKETAPNFESQGTKVGLMMLFISCTISPICPCSSESIYYRLLVDL